MIRTISTVDASVATHRAVALSMAHFIENRMVEVIKISNEVVSGPVFEPKLEGLQPGRLEKVAKCIKDICRTANRLGESLGRNKRMDCSHGREEVGHECRAEKVELRKALASSKI